MNKTVDANVQSETHVFHNGWYGYKNWGIGLACYATYYENPRAPEYLRVLQDDWHSRAAPALELAGAGGGWAEGYYINYFLYEWLFFCEVARHCEGLDFYADAPQFFRQRAVASMFETYPGIGTYDSRRPIPMGDGGGRTFGGDRDKTLSARRILVNHFRDDPAHQVVHAFNETTPRSSVGAYAYKDFLWRDPTVPQGDLSKFRLSHISPGPGYVYARSSWDEDATYFFFKCGDRFTAHQHLDVGHFLIYKHEELAGDGGHYDEFGTTHDVNYHLRTIAHSTILVYDPSETWPGIRAGTVTGNDGGQHHNWPHHNGAVADPAEWQRERKLYDIADLLAFEDTAAYVYVAGDCTRAYSPQKLACFTRQIVFLRPGTFVIFDRVCSTKPEFKKTWLLQAMKPPTQAGRHLVVTNGKGRLFVQTLLPENPQVRLVAGADLYTYGGHSYPPSRDTGPAPECRIEISPGEPRTTDYFLHVLTATGAEVAECANATATVGAEPGAGHGGRRDDHVQRAQGGRELRVGRSQDESGRDRSLAVHPAIGGSKHGREHRRSRLGAGRGRHHRDGHGRDCQCGQRPARPGGRRGRRDPQEGRAAHPGGVRPDRRHLRRRRRHHHRRRAQGPARHPCRRAADGRRRRGREAPQRHAQFAEAAPMSMASRASPFRRSAPASSVFPSSGAPRSC